MFNYPNPMPRSFDEFRRSGKLSSNLVRDVPDYAEGAFPDAEPFDEPARVGMVYAGDLVIELHGFGEWSLTLCNEQHSGRDLSELEARLYESHYLAEHMQHIEPRRVLFGAFRSMIAAARPTADSEWGSERQVEAENRLWDRLGLEWPQYFGEDSRFARYALKATTEESLAEAGRIIAALEAGESPYPEVPAEVMLEAAALFDSLFDIGTRLAVLYEANPELNNIQPERTAHHSRERFGVFPLSVDEWAAEASGVAEEWRRMAESAA